MHNAPPPQQRETGIQPDPTLQPDHKVSPVTMTLAALAGVAIVTLVLYGLNTSPRESQMASTSPPAAAQDPAAASENTAGQNASDTSKPAQGQAKQQENTAAAQSDRANTPQGSQTGQPQTTTGQAPSNERQGASPVRPNG